MFRRQRFFASQVVVQISNPNGAKCQRRATLEPSVDVGFSQRDAGCGYHRSHCHPIVTRTGRNPEAGGRVRSFVICLVRQVQLRGRSSLLNERLRSR